MLCLEENIATIIFQHSIVRWLRMHITVFSSGDSMECGGKVALRNTDFPSLIKRPLSSISHTNIFKTSLRPLAKINLKSVKTFLVTLELNILWTTVKMTPTVPKRNSSELCGFYLEYLTAFSHPALTDTAPQENVSRLLLLGFCKRNGEHNPMIYPWCGILPYWIIVSCWIPNHDIQPNLILALFDISLSTMEVSCPVALFCS